MKFIEKPKVTNMSALLQGGIDCGDRVVQGRLEMFSISKTHTDRKHSDYIVKRELSELSNGSTAIRASASGGGLSAVSSPRWSVAGSPRCAPGMSPPLRVPHSPISTREVLLNLISTIHQTYSGYDYSNLTADKFQLTDLRTVQNEILDLNGVVQRARPGFYTELWDAIRDGVTLEDCEIFCYSPMAWGDDPPCPGRVLWSMTLAFLDRKQKCVLALSCSTLSKLLGSESGGSDYLDPDADCYEYPSLSAALESRGSPGNWRMDGGWMMDHIEEEMTSDVDMM